MEVGEDEQRADRHDEDVHHEAHDAVALGAGHRVVGRRQVVVAIVLEGPRPPAGELAVLGVLLLVVIVGICAPVIEEIFYRGLFQQSLLKRGLPPAAAIGINATVFGLSHGELLQLPALILFGVVAGILAHRAGRLGPAIAAHVVFNMVTVVALLAAG
jgi:membrane protease YdiL (CAAX protease family)